MDMIEVCLGYIDEAWDVETSVFTEGLEPSQLERISPQSVLTSTAHRRATSLMKSRIQEALDEDDSDVLLLYWGAPQGVDPGDPQVWREASPHWSPERASMLQKKYEAALRGESDPQADDPDPMMGFVSQYLNQWQLSIRERPAPGIPVVTEAEWSNLETTVPPGPPTALAVESWFDQGTALVKAWNTDGIITVSATSYPTVALAAAACHAEALNSPVRVGKSLLASEPLFKGLWTAPAQGTTISAVRELGRLAAEGSLRHDGSPELTAQVLALRIVAAPDGVRLVSKHRADCVKAVSFVVAAAKEVLEPSQIF
jgi:phage terminase large subunit-like protein